MKNGQTVRVAIIGVGNCASSLVQGVEFYRSAAEDGFVPGLMHVNLGGYRIDHVEFSAAFDVVESKVGLDLSEAIFAAPNNTIKFTGPPSVASGAEAPRRGDRPAPRRGTRAATPP